MKKNKKKKIYIVFSLLLFSILIGVFLNLSISGYSTKIITRTNTNNELSFLTNNCFLDYREENLSSQKRNKLIEFALKDDLSNNLVNSNENEIIISIDSLTGFLLKNLSNDEIIHHANVICCADKSKKNSDIDVGNGQFVLVCKGENCVDET